MSPGIGNKGFRRWSGPWCCITGTLLFLLAACSKEEDATAGPLSSLQAIPVGDTLKGIIGENILLTNNRTWYIDGWVYIANEASLSIEPGTLLKILKNERSGVSGGVIVTRGAKIIAPGTPYAPIVLTCNDTSVVYNVVRMGIILLGKAPVKQPLAVTGGFPDLNGSLAYGGLSASDSSGVLQHVRIIYPYTKYRQDSLRTGLFFLGTGNRTVIKDISVRPVITGVHIKLK